jgi:hypothetical protein
MCQTKWGRLSFVNKNECLSINLDSITCSTIVVQLVKLISLLVRLGSWAVGWVAGLSAHNDDLLGWFARLQKSSNFLGAQKRRWKISSA